LARVQCDVCQRDVRPERYDGEPEGGDKEVGMLTAIDHVQLAMPRGGEDRAREFYGARLGLVEEPKPPELAVRGGCWFGTGSVRVHLGVDADFRPARKAHPAFRVAGLTAFVAEHGLVVLWDDGPGPVHCYVDDPFENRIELVEDAAP
jgi:catechol 2,3-dioxygenase-like lactoylglutathione lyase family enzyme